MVIKEDTWVFLSDLDDQGKYISYWPIIYNLLVQIKKKNPPTFIRYVCIMTARSNITSFNIYLHWEKIRARYFTSFITKCSNSNRSNEIRIKAGVLQNYQPHLNNRIFSKVYYCSKTTGRDICVYPSISRGWIGGQFIGFLSYPSWTRQKGY